MITATPVYKNDLEKDYKGISKEKLVGMPLKEAEKLILDQCILDEVEKCLGKADVDAVYKLMGRRNLCI